MFVLKFNNKASRFISGTYITQITFTPYSFTLVNSRIDEALRFDTWEEVNHVLNELKARKCDNIEIEEL